MAPIPEVRVALPGDVVRRSPKRPAEVFESLVRFLDLKGEMGNDQTGDAQMSVLSVLSSREPEPLGPGSDGRSTDEPGSPGWLEVDLMLEFVVFRLVVRVFDAQLTGTGTAGTLISFRDLLGQALGLGGGGLVAAVPELLLLLRFKLCTLEDALRFNKLVHLIEQGALAAKEKETPREHEVDFEEEPLEPGSGSEPETTEQTLEAVLTLMRSCLESQKSAPDAAQILAFWAHDSPRTRSKIARAAAQQNVVQALRQSKQKAALQQSTCITPEEFAALKPDAMRSDATPLAGLTGITRAKLGDPYSPCESEDLPKAPSDDGTGTATASPSSSQSCSLSQNRRSCSDVLSSD
ncbi:unnamed protein product [Symbiodinium sp. CCMP2592]|nr:unnamed protein product [Symbiodinium sp. CCMP2592]